MFYVFYESNQLKWHRKFYENITLFTVYFSQMQPILTFWFYSGFLLQKTTKYSRYSAEVSLSEYVSHIQRKSWLFMFVQFKIHLFKVHNYFKHSSLLLCDKKQTYSMRQNKLPETESAVLFFSICCVSFWLLPSFHVYYFCYLVYNLVTKYI